MRSSFRTLVLRGSSYLRRCARRSKSSSSTSVLQSVHGFNPFHLSLFSLQLIRTSKTPFTSSPVTMISSFIFRHFTKTVGATTGKGLFLNKDSRMERYRCLASMSDSRGLSLTAHQGRIQCNEVRRNRRIALVEYCTLAAELDHFPYLNWY